MNCSQPGLSGARFANWAGEKHWQFAKQRERRTDIAAQIIMRIIKS